MLDNYNNYTDDEITERLVDNTGHYQQDSYDKPFQQPYDPRNNPSNVPGPYNSNNQQPYNQNPNQPNNAPEVHVYNVPYRPTTGKSKIAAALLAFFLGNLGIQRFYLGYTTSGVVLLVLDILGWLTLWIGIGFFIILGVSIFSFVDFIRILVGNLQPKDGYYTSD